MQEEMHTEKVNVWKNRLRNATENCILQKNVGKTSCMEMKCISKKWKIDQKTKQPSKTKMEKKKMHAEKNQKNWNV